MSRDEEFANENQGEEAAETTLNAEWTLTTHTCTKTIQSEETAETTLNAKYTRTTHAHVKNDKGEEADKAKQDAKYTLSTHTCVTNKIPNLFARGQTLSRTVLSWSLTRRTELRRTPRHSTTLSTR